jgi:hypothetical protein
MDDYSLVSLGDSKNEWCARLVNTLTPCIIEGLKSIFEEAWKLCVENEEDDKYLMTFQTFLSRIPKWNPDIIEKERVRIEQTSGCGYLEDLITCVHVIQLKALTCVRVGQQQKKVDIDIPPINDFVHKVYSNVARKLYTSVYLFEKDILPLQIQRHNRELETIIKECILNTVRDTMPVENILRAYMDETEELDVKEEVVVINKEPIVENADAENSNLGTKDLAIRTDVAKIVAPAQPQQNQEQPEQAPQTQELLVQTQQAPPSPHNTLVAASEPPAVPTPKSVPDAVPGVPATSPTANDKVNFSDVDATISVTGVEANILAPKTDERLEKIAELSADRRKREEEEEEDEDKITIGDNISLEITDINNLNTPVTVNDSPILSDIEVLG